MRARGTASLAALFGVLALGALSCAGTRTARPASAAAPPRLPPGAEGGTAPPTAASGEAQAIPTDAWLVRVFPKFDDRAPARVERWPSLEHTWSEPCGPGKLFAQRRLCLPRGSYVVESRSSDHVEVKVDGTPVIAPRIELARTIGEQAPELSRPIAIDGCVLVEAEMPSEGCFPQSHIRTFVREARSARPCDESSYPRGSWNACIFAGRRQEEIVESAIWDELVSPWPRGGSPTGDDSFSVEARTTACFDKGRYVFHTRVPPDRLVLFIDEVLRIDPRPRTPRSVFDSEPIPLEGCRALRARYAALDRDTTFELRWAKVGSASERRWAAEAMACDPACAADARCVAGGPFGLEGKTARVCLPNGRPGQLGEACSEKQACARGVELACCRAGACGHGSGVCTYRDR